MSAQEYQALLPFIILGYAAVALLVLGAFWRNHSAIGIMTLVSLAAAFLAIPVAFSVVPVKITQLLLVDSLFLFYLALFILSGFVIAVLSHDYLKSEAAGSERCYALLLLFILGAGVLAASNHFVSFFVGLELLSVSLYGLTGYTLRRPVSLEASLKYLVLAGASLAFLLLGMAFIYFEYGSMEFSSLAESFQVGMRLSPITLLGVGLILVGFAFKLAMVPFHTWAPDVYQGAPAPIGALVATGSKASLFILLLRFLGLFSSRQQDTFFLLLAMLAVITMFGGNLLALLQQNLKRLLAYSSVAHIGYLLIPLLAGGEQGVASISFYFISYFLATIGAFGIIAVLSRPDREREKLADYRGLGYQRPWLGAALALMMFSLAGIPPTMGFMAKFYIFAAAAHSGLWLLLVIGVLNSGLAAYYYLRVIITIYDRREVLQSETGDGTSASAVMLAVISGAVLMFGVYPTTLIALVKSAVGLWRVH